VIEIPKISHCNVEVLAAVPVNIYCTKKYSMQLTDLMKCLHASIRFGNWLIYKIQTAQNLIWERSAVIPCPMWGLGVTDHGVLVNT